MVFILFSTVILNVHLGRPVKALLLLHPDHSLGHGGPLPEDVEIEIQLVGVDPGPGSQAEDDLVDLPDSVFPGRAVHDVHDLPADCSLVHQASASPGLRVFRNTSRRPGTIFRTSNLHWWTHWPQPMHLS